MDEENLDILTNPNKSSADVEEISIYDVFSKTRHRIILFWISITVLLLPLSDTIYLPAIYIISKDLKTSEALVNLTISLYLLFVGISSLIWGVISDRWGRNISMRIGLLLFLISSILCIFVSNIELFSLLRVCQGSSISVAMVVGQSIIADIYPADERGRATGIFFIPVLLGVVIGPTFGGILTYYVNWRSVFIFQSIMTLLILIIYIIIIPETHQYLVLLKLKDKKLIERNEIIKPKLINPFVPFKYLINLEITPHILAASVAFASIIINQCLLAIALAQPPYSYNELKIGIANIPLSIGEILGCILGGYASDKADRFFKNKRLENRLVPGTIIFLLIPIGLIIYGWTFQYKLNVSLPIISAAIVAFAQSVYRPAVYSYLTIKEQQNAATVASANNSLNFIFAAIGLSIAVPIINAINSGPFFTIIAFVNIIVIILATTVPLNKVIFINKNYQQL